MGYIYVDRDGDMDFTIRKEVHQLLESLSYELNNDKTIPEDNIHILANEEEIIAAIQLDNNYLLFIPGEIRYISAKSLLQAFASLYSISRGEGAATLTRTTLKEKNKSDIFEADIITYNDDATRSLKKGTYRRY